MKKILLLASCAALWVSCDKDDSCKPQPTDEIRISAVIANISPLNTPKTRTAYTNGSKAAWADGDALGLFCEKAVSNASNIQFSVANTSSTPKWSATTSIYWLDNTTPHKFLAYAPYLEGNTDAAAVKLPALSTQTGTLNSAQDFLISNNLNSVGVARKDGAAINLTFTHALSLIECQMVAGVGLASNATPTSFILAGASGEKLYTTDDTSTISLASGKITVTTGTNTATITPTTPPALTSTAKSYYTLIAPGTYTSPTVSINITEGSNTYTTTAASLGTTIFEPGKKYSYLVTISRTAISISSATITDWDPVTGSPITPGI